MSFELSIESHYAGYMKGSSIDPYTGPYADMVAEGCVVGQIFTSGGHHVYRSVIAWDLSGLPEDAYITAAYIELDCSYYGINIYPNTQDFEITLVGSTANIPLLYTDFTSFSDYSDPTFGYLDTSTFGDEDRVTITLNSDGVEYLSGSDTVFQIGLVSSRDILQISPGLTHFEFVEFDGHQDSWVPRLVVTYANWPNDRYPDVPDFPDTGKVDLPTYAVIRSYLTDFSNGALAGPSGKVNPGPNMVVTWDGTEQEISYNESLYSSIDGPVDTGIAWPDITGIVLTSLSSNSTIDLTTSSADIYADDLTVSSAASVANATVLGGATLSEAAMLSLEDQLATQATMRWVKAARELDYSGYWADIMLDTNGDLKARIEGDAGIKTKLLGDFDGDMS